MTSPRDSTSLSHTPPPGFVFPVLGHWFSQGNISAGLWSGDDLILIYFAQEIV